MKTITFVVMMIVLLMGCRNEREPGAIPVMPEDPPVSAITICETEIADSVVTYGEPDVIHYYVFPTYSIVRYGWINTHLIYFQDIDGVCVVSPVIF